MKSESFGELIRRLRIEHNLSLRITHELEDLLGRKVDVVEEGKLKPKVARIVKSEKKLVYER